MKKLLLILFLLILYLGSCWWVDLDKDLIVLDSSGRSYQNLQTFFYEKHDYIKDPRNDMPAYKETVFKWDRVVGLGIIIGYCTFFVVRMRKDGRNNV